MSDMYIKPEHPTKKRKLESDGSEAAKAPAKKSRTSSRSPEPSTPTPAKYTRSDLVTLLVGPDEQELVVYGHLLAKTSEFFEVALKMEWKEGQTRIIKLPEEDAGTITHYLDFVHGQGLPTRYIKLYTDIQKDDGEEYLVLAKLYAFGERVLDTAVRNAVMEEILRIVSLQSDDGRILLPEDDTISTFYEATPANSPARRLLVDLHVSYGTTYSLAFETCDMMYLADLARAFNERVEESLHTDEFRYCPLNPDDYLF